jgi:hypothetical protein
MDAFTYLSVLLSIIIGLGISHLLTASGRLITHRDRVRFHWPALLWAGVLLLVFIQSWWAMFVLRHYTTWTFPAFAIVLLQTIALYMVAAIVLPEKVDEAGVDLRIHYEKHRRWLFGFLLAAVVVSVAKDVILYGRFASPENLAFHAFFAISCVSAMLVRGERFNEILAVVAALLMGAYVAILFARLH